MPSWLFPSDKFITLEDAQQKESDSAANAAQALADVGYTPPSPPDRSLFGVVRSQLLNTFPNQDNSLPGTDEAMQYAGSQPTGIFSPPQPDTSLASTLQPYRGQGAASFGDVASYIANAVRANRQAQQESVGNAYGQTGQESDVGTTTPEASARANMGELTSGNQFISSLTHGNVDTNDLPGPLAQAVDIGAAPLSLLSVGGSTAGGGLAAGAKTAARIGLATAAQRGTEAALPGGTPEIIAQPLELASGLAAESGGSSIGRILRDTVSPGEIPSASPDVSYAVRPRSGVVMPPEFQGLSDKEIGAIFRDRTQSPELRQKAADWLSRNVASVTGATSDKAPVAIGDLADKPLDELNQLQVQSTKANWGQRFKDALSKEIDKRLGGNGPKMGIGDFGEGQPINQGDQPIQPTPSEINPQTGERYVPGQPSMLENPEAVVNPEGTPATSPAPIEPVTQPKPALTLERIINGFSNTVRGATTLGDIAIGRLSSSAAMTDTGNYFKAIAQGFKEAFHPGSNQEFIKSLEDVPGEAKTWYRPVADGGYGLQGDPTELNPGLISKVPVLGNVANLQRNIVDALRPMILKARIANLLESGRVTEDDLLKPEVRADIGRSVNLVTGGSSIPFLQGPVSRLFLNFPNWLASQVELNLRAFETGSVTGDIARKAVLRNLAMGAMVTEAANMISSKTINPITAATAHTRYGVPMGRLPGQDWNFDAFGPTIDLLSTLAGVGVRAANDSPSKVPGDVGSGLFNFYRSQAGPIPRIAIDQLTHKDFAGNNISDGTQRAWDLVQNLMPFNAAGALEGRQPGPEVAGALGIRTHQPTEMTHALNEAGITPDNPDYLIQRRDFLAKNPDLETNTDANATRQDIATKLQANSDELTAPNSTTTLGDFRAQRKQLIQERRDKLEALLGADTNGISNAPHADWLNSYFKLFQDATDSKTGKLDQNKMDSIEQDWIAKNGPDALDFVNRYLNAGQSPADTAYQQDMQSLAKDGYFNMEKYRGLTSGISDADIKTARTLIDSARADNPTRYKGQPVSYVAQYALRGKYTPAQIRDIVGTYSTTSKSPALAKFETAHAKELMWLLHPAATWDAYQKAR